MRNFFIWISLMAVTNIIAADYYWVGTSNSWTTLSNWRLGSTTGATPSTALISTDNVFITAGTVNPALPTTAVTINALTIGASKSLNVNGTPTFTINGSVSLQSGSITTSSTTLTTVININNTDVTIGTSTGNLGFTVGAVAPNDKINLNITTAKFRNYGSLNSYANIALTYKVNSTTPADNFINVLGSSNYRGTFTLTINENTIATKFGESAGTDTFWKAVAINKYSNVDFSFGTTNDAYVAVFEEKLTLNGESKVGTNVSNLILGDQCNATITLKKGLDLAFTKNTTIILGKNNASKQPNINVTGGNIASLALQASYTQGNFEAYKTNVSVGTTSVNLSTIGSITIDKTSSFTGATTLVANNLTVNAATFTGAAALTVSTPTLKIANTTAVTFAGDLSITSPQFTTATLLGAAGTVPINIQKNLTLSQTTPITTYANTNVNGFKYAVFNGASGNQTYTTNSLVPFYRLDVNKNSGNLVLASQIFFNYSIDNTTDVININLTKGKIVGSETNRVIIYRSRYTIAGFTNANYIAAGVVLKSNDATNLPLKKFLPVGSTANYAPIEITSNTGSSNFIVVTYFDQNPQLLNNNFTGGALDVSNCEYWKIVEVDANLASLAVASLFDLDKVSLTYTISKCTKISQTNHAVGYSFKNGAVYTPWEKLATSFVANSNGATTSYIAGAIEPAAKILKSQAEILVSFSYQNVLIINTTDVYNNPCLAGTLTDGNYNFNSGTTGTNGGIVKMHPENNENVFLYANSGGASSTYYNMLINIGADGKPYAVRDEANAELINAENISISNYTVSFKNSEPVSTSEQYTNNLSTDGITLATGTTFTITTPVGIIPTKLDVYNGATLVGSTTPGAPTANSPISVTTIPATTGNSYRFVLAVKNLANEPLTVTGYFIK